MKIRKLPKKSTPQIKAYEAAVRRGQKDYHVVRSADGWSVKKPGAERSSGKFSTQTEAISAARKMSKGAVYIHGRDGKIRDKI